ncbi:MAG: DUF2147 domain-containing protein [Bacteroidales bacterium]|nr:DUF2147 domain-containing protein [Bacteroidales bacterium]
MKRFVFMMLTLVLAVSGAFAQADQIVLIDKVTYKNEKWADGKIYDPTSGKVFTVTLYFKDAKTLTVKGSIGPFFQRMYWTKMD